MVPPVNPRRRKDRKSSFISLLFGWIYILVALSIIFLLFNRPSPPDRLVCNRALGYSLTGFGSCHME